MPFLPPYSHCLIPIEQVFARLKTLLGKADERTVEATWRQIGSRLDAFPPQEYANYLRNFGDASMETDQTLGLLLSVALVGAP